MSLIAINGKTYNIPDNETVVVIQNGKILVGSAELVSGLVGEVQVRWEGPLAKLHTDAALTVNGNVQGNVSAGGSVQCGSVGGNIDAGGSVQACCVAGSVDAGGSVRCGSIGGDVDAGGSVRRG